MIIITGVQVMKFFQVLLSCIGLYGMGIVLIKVISELRGWDFYGRDLLSVFCVSLSYLIGLLLMVYVLEKVESVRRIKKTGRDDRHDEWGKGGSWLMFGAMAFMQLWFLVPVLFMSIKDFRFTLPFWFLVIYGLITGCGWVVVMSGLDLLSDINNGVIRWLENKEILSSLFLILMIILYPVIAALLIHAINLKATLKNCLFAQTLRCGWKFYPRHINYMPAAKFPSAP